MMCSLCAQSKKHNAVRTSADSCQSGLLASSIWLLARIASARCAWPPAALRPLPSLSRARRSTVSGIREAPPSDVIAVESSPAAFTTLAAIWNDAPAVTVSSSCALAERGGRGAPGILQPGQRDAERPDQDRELLRG